MWASMKFLPCFKCELALRHSKTFRHHKYKKIILNWYFKIFLALQKKETVGQLCEKIGLQCACVATAFLFALIYE